MAVINIIFRALMSQPGDVIMKGIQRIAWRKLSRKVFAIYRSFHLLSKTADYAVTYRHTHITSAEEVAALTRRLITYRLQMTLQCICRPFHNHFQDEFSTECYLVLIISINSILSVPQGHPLVTYIFFRFFLSLPSFPSLFVQLPCVRKQSPRQM